MTAGRYRPVAPRAEWVWSYGLDAKPVVVIEEERQPRETGLVDQHGAKIYRVPARHPCGFLASGKEDS